MISRIVERAAEAVPIAVRESFGNRLRALYLYGSVAEGRYRPQQSDINLIAVVKDDVTLREVRQAMRPLWLREFNDLRIAPLVASWSVFQRHLKLNPIWAKHLYERATLLAGAELLPQPEPISDAEKLARIAHEAMLASSALAPTLLPDKAAKKSISDLHGLANILSATVNREDLVVAGLMADVQNHVSREMRRQNLPLYQGKSFSRKPLLISELQAIYETENRIVLVLPDLSPERITEVISTTDWAEVARRVEGKYQALLLTTAGQLLLILKYETAADYQLQNYVHAWGKDPVAGVNIADWCVFRQLARLPSELQLATLPQAYIDADERALSRLVHDFQNMLLNIQLRSELIGKITGRLTKTPSMTLPDRNVEVHDRVAGIYEHLGWWSDYHTATMEHLLIDTS